MAVKAGAAVRGVGFLEFRSSGVDGAENCSVRGKCGRYVAGNGVEGRGAEICGMDEKINTWSYIKVSSSTSAPRLAAMIGR